MARHAGDSVRREGRTRHGARAAEAVRRVAARRTQHVAAIEARMDRGAVGGGSASEAAAAEAAGAMGTGKGGRRQQQREGAGDDSRTRQRGFGCAEHDGSPGSSAPARQRTGMAALSVQVVMLVVGVELFLGLVLVDALGEATHCVEISGTDDDGN